MSEPRFLNVIRAAPGWRVAEIAGSSCHDSKPEVRFKTIVAWAEPSDRRGELVPVCVEGDCPSLLPISDSDPFFLCIVEPGEDFEPWLVEQWVEQREREKRGAA